MNQEEEKWQVLSTGYALDHPWCRVRVDQVRFPSGAVDDYYLVELPAVALVFPVTQDGNVLLVKQYKHGAGKDLLELPGGCFTPEKEGALAAAKRELQEETGGVSDSWTFLGKMFENPTKATNEIHLFLAQDVVQSSPQHLDLTENIEIVSRPLADIMPMVRSGEICASTSLALILHALDHLDLENKN